MTFKRMIVPYEGGALSEDALRLACDFAGDVSRITAVYVVRMPPSMPIGAEGADEELGRETLRRAEAIGRELGASVETYLAKAPEVAEGINETAATLDADAIVMSLRHKHAPGETLVLSHTPVAADLKVCHAHRWGRAKALQLRLGHAGQAPVPGLRVLGFSP